MRFLVTGGCGFIGSHLGDALMLAGHNVTVLDDLSTGCESQLTPGARLVRGSVLDEECLAKAMQDVQGCFHLAARSNGVSGKNWLTVHKINQLGALNVFFSASANTSRPAVPVVYASSAAVYGDNACFPLSESAHPRPVSAYGADKLGCELHARVAWLVNNVPTTGLRFFNVYGPRQNSSSPYSKVISMFIEHLLNNKVLRYAGDAQQTIDFVYVTDVVRFLISTMFDLRDQASIYNVCTGRSISIRELAQTLTLLAGQSIDIIYTKNNKGNIASSLGDPEKASKKLQMRCETTLAQGLKLTLEAEFRKINSPLS